AQYEFVNICHFSDGRRDIFLRVKNYIFLLFFVSALASAHPVYETQAQAEAACDAAGAATGGSYGSGVCAYQNTSLGPGYGFSFYITSSWPNGRLASYNHSNNLCELDSNKSACDYQYFKVGTCPEGT